MWNPDLLLTKATALKRLEAQRIGGDPYAPSVTARVCRGGQPGVQLRQLQTHLGDRLVCWGQRLQQYAEPQSLLR